MKLWIVGKQGLLARELQKSCVQKNIPHFATGREEADLCDFESLERAAGKIQPTHIVNCAAYTDVDGAEKERELAWKMNAQGPAYLARLAEKSGARFIQISTDYVFDGRKGAPYKEEDVPSPAGVYGRTKNEGEKLALEALPSSCIIRTSWLFAPGGKNFISTILRILQEREEVKAVHDQIGSPTFCPDLAEAILKMLDWEGTFHFANEGVVSRYQIATDFYAEAKKRGIALACRSLLPISAAEFKTPAPRPAYSALCTEKFAKHAGRKPRTWKETLNEYLDATG